LTTELDEKTSVRMPAIHPIVMQREGGEKLLPKYLRGCATYSLA
jgi:hypothetical protein